MIKYMNEIKASYGSMFFTDRDNLCYDLEEAICRSGRSFAIINPFAPGKIDKFEGKILDSYYELSILAKVRRIDISPDIRTRLLREYFSIYINNELITAYYDYGFLFNEKAPNLVGEKIIHDKEEMTLAIRPYNIPYKYYSSPDQYLNSEYEKGDDIYASYVFAETSDWDRYDTKTLMRKVNLYRKNHGLPKLEMLKGTD